MKHILYSFFIIILIPKVIFSQSIVGDTDTLGSVKTSFSDIENYFNSKGSLRMEGTIDFVPVQIHIIKKNATQNLNWASSRIYTDIKDLNKVFLEQGMQFYMCDSIHSIIDSELSPFISKYSKFETYNVPGKINIYYTEFLDYSVGGFASLGPTNDGYVAMSLAGSSLDLIHEIGHYLNLLHTHDTSYGKELVNGSNCSVAGDLVCDTPADPNMFGRTTNCVYNASTVDANGDLYKPDGSNYMSYASSYCLGRFSAQQKQRMRYYYENVALPRFIPCEKITDLSLAFDNYTTRVNKGEYNEIRLKIFNNTIIPFTGAIDIKIRITDGIQNVYTASEKQWIASIAGYSQDTVSLLILVPNEILNGNVEIEALIDPVNRIKEIEEHNNTAKVTATAFPRSYQLGDLVVSLKGESKSEAGLSYSFLTSIKNIGSKDVGGVDFYLVVSEDSIFKESEEGIYLGIGSLKSLGSDSFTMSVGMPQTPGKSYWVFVFADYDKTIPELDENNNLGMLKVTIEERKSTTALMDFQASKSTTGIPVLKILSSSKIDFKYQNINDASAQFVLVGTFISKDSILSDDDLLLSTQIERIFSSSSDYTAFFAIPETITAGSYYIIQKLDLRDHFFESNEKNNVVAIPVTVQDAVAPYLIFTENELSSSNWYYNIPNQWKGKITNVGAGVSSNWELLWYLENSKEKLLPAGTNANIFYSIGWSSVTKPPIPAQDTIQLEVPLTVTSTYEPGTYYLGLCVKDTKDAIYNKRNCYAFENPIIVRKTMITSNDDRDAEFENYLLFPNPMKGKGFVNSFSSEIKTLTFTSVGSLIKYTIIVKNGQFSVDHLEPGMYFVQIPDNNGLRMQKVIVEN